MTITATRIAEINATIENLKIARAYCGDATVKATITKRLSTITSERQQVMDAIVATSKTRRTVKAAPVEKVEQIANVTTTLAAAPRKPKADWKTRPASDAQVKRIRHLENEMGYKMSNRSTIGNAGNASALYQSLKSEYVSL